MTEQENEPSCIPGHVLDGFADLGEDAAEQCHTEGDAQGNDEQREQTVDQGPRLCEQAGEVKGKTHWGTPFYSFEIMSRVMIRVNTITIEPTPATSRPISHQITNQWNALANCA